MIRAVAAGQLPDLAQALHAHLHHGVLHAFVQAEQRVRHADLVVLVPLCPECFAESRKYRVTELFCRRFAHAARHARQQRAVQRAVVRAQPDHRIQRVRHLLVGEIPGVGPLQAHHPGVAAELPGQLAVAHIDGIDLAGSAAPASSARSA